ncbi:hypothetical protein EZS27_011648 [termite gut metagenome]|uniref:Uncharacterized protein n=1 Tax=termite gut metagenome TaxID=433724 RepID=A0A5J4S563_9ZZZZ
MKHSLIDQSDERIISLLETIEKLSRILSEITKHSMRRPLNNEFYLTT